MATTHLSPYSQFLTKHKFEILNLKFLAYFTATFYMLSFGIHGTNLFGEVDALIPFERAILTICGSVFLILTLTTLFKITKTYLEIKQNAKNQKQ